MIKPAGMQIRYRSETIVVEEYGLKVPKVIVWREITIRGAKCSNKKD